MTTYYRAAFISELHDPDGYVADCVWTSGLRQANGASGGKHPSTLQEAEALRAEVGGSTSAGADSAQLIAATTKRYAWASTEIDTPAGIIAAAKPGVVLTLSGLYGNLSTHLRRWSPFFGGRHRTSVDVEDGPKFWWVDPLAPPDSGYTGEYVTLADLTAFAKGGSGGTVAPLHVLPTAYTLHIAANAIVTSYGLGAGGCLTDLKSQKWGATASSAPCGAPVTKPGCSSGSAKVALVTKGVFAGRWVKLTSAVTVS